MYIPTTAIDTIISIITIIILLTMFNSIVEFIKLISIQIPQTPAISNIPRVFLNKQDNNSELDISLTL